MLAAYLALLEPGDTLLGMSLDHGGHLTHGAQVNFSGKLFNAVQYGVDPRPGEIDYEQVERLAQEHRPKLIIAGFSAYSRVVDWSDSARIADDVGACFARRYRARRRTGCGRASIRTRWRTRTSSRRRRTRRCAVRAAA